MIIQTIELNQELYDIFYSFNKKHHQVRFERLRGNSNELNRKNFNSEVRFIQLFTNRSEYSFLRFFRNMPIENRFIGDFVDLNRMIIVEIDGSVHDIAGAKRRDKRRTKYLTARGWKIIRLSTKQSNKEWLDIFDKAIKEVIDFRHKKAYTKRNKHRHTQFLKWIKTYARISHDLNKAPVQLIEITDNPSPL